MTSSMLYIHTQLSDKLLDREIQTIADLEDNWDSYGAKGTDEKAVEKLRELVKIISSIFGRKPYHIGPHEYRGIHALWGDTVWEFGIGVHGETLEIDTSLELSVRFENKENSHLDFYNTAQIAKKLVETIDDDNWYNFLAHDLDDALKEIEIFSERYGSSN